MAKNTEFNRFQTQMWLKTQSLTGSEFRCGHYNTEFYRFRTQMWPKIQNLTGSELKMQLNEQMWSINYILTSFAMDAAKQSNIMKKPIPKTSKTAERCLKKLSFFNIFAKFLKILEFHALIWF